jgi:cytochrome b561
MSSSRYTRTAMAFHWLIALLILCNVLLAWSFDIVPNGWGRPAVDLHKSIGVTVLGLAVLRLIWRSTHRPPALPRSFPKLERAAAHVVHIGLYLLILAIPLSGWMHDSAWRDAAAFPMHWFGLFEWPRIGFIMHLDPNLKETLHGLFGRIHTWLAYVLYGLFLLHVGGALKHEWWDRESVLRRMLPWGRVDGIDGGADGG